MFLKTTVLLLPLLIPVIANGQNTAPISGELQCSIGGKSWKGKVQSAIYSKQDDYITIGFEDDAARLEVTFRGVKKNISPYIPYTDEIQGEFKSGYDPGIMFFLRYFPDKKLADHYETAYTILNGGFAVDALDLTNMTIQIAFEVTCGKATSRYNPFKPDENDLEKLEITNATSTVIKFIAF